jgi:hypothetical protein
MARNGNGGVMAMAYQYGSRQWREMAAMASK